MKFIQCKKEYELRSQQYILTDDRLRYTASPIEVLPIVDENGKSFFAIDDDLFMSILVLDDVNKQR